MKQLLTIITLAALLSACTKSTSSSNTTATGLFSTFSFTANDTTYEDDSSLANNSDNGSILQWQNGEYQLRAAYAPNGFIHNSIIMNVTSGTLSETTYQQTYQPNSPFFIDVQIDGIDYVQSSVGDYSTITITNIHDGGIYADGTFSGHATSFYDGGTPSFPSGLPLSITNGVFKNVKILNQ